MARTVVVLAVILFAACSGHGLALEKKKKHHKHHHGHKHKTGKKEVVAAKHADAIGAATAATKAVPAPNIVKLAAKASGAASKHNASAPASEKEIEAKMKSLEKELAVKEASAAGVAKGLIEVNAPLPADFSERFAQAVAQATGSDPSEVKVVEAKDSSSDVAEVTFEAPPDIIKAVEAQAADPDSKLANGALHSFLVAKDEASGEAAGGAETPVQEKGIDVDTEMPYGELEPFGREDTAQELTEQSIRESDEMVDQLERAEVAEEKRSVFRALTRLRGAAITSFDGVARAQTGNIDEYNKVHKWRKTHPLHHLADEESDISKWAFPDNADF